MSNASEFAKQVNVSRETLARLETYAALLLKWNPAINLIAKSTLDDLWSRHMLDSAQILSLVSEDTTSWVDLGSGGGFPGLVVAAMAFETHPGLHMTLVESDQRKSTFLRTVIRELGLNAKVISKRIEDVKDVQAQVVSARALASLEQLFDWSEPYMTSETVCIFPKGATVEKEIQEALASWVFAAEKFQSKTDSHATILKIGEIQRV